MAFPTTSVLDAFNRANEGPPPSSSWVSTGILNVTPGLSVVSNTMADNAGFSGGAWGTQFGADTETFVTVATLMANSENCRLLARCAQIGNNTTLDGYMALFERFDGIGGFTLRYYRIDNGSFTQLGSDVLDTSGSLATGVKFGLEIIGSTITAYVNRSGTWVAKTTATDATYSVPGYIGFYASDTLGRYDDFGGGTVVMEAATLMLAMGMLGTGRV